MENADIFLLWFSKWKDVTTTVVALLAIFVVVFQIKQSGRFEKNRIRREQVAARATLPLTLNALSKYGEEMLTALVPLERWLERELNDQESFPGFSKPKMPIDTILAVEKVIAAYPEDEVARALAAVMNEVQVLDSRTRNYSNNEQSIRSWSSAMKDNVVRAAGIVARCESLYTFARKGSEYGEPTRSHIQRVLSINKINQILYPRVWDATEHFADDPKPKWWQRKIPGKILNRFR